MGKSSIVREAIVAPCVFHQQLSDEALGQFARVAEELLVKFVAHG